MRTTQISRSIGFQRVRSFKSRFPKCSLSMIILLTSIGSLISWARARRVKSIGPWIETTVILSMR